MNLRYTCVIASCPWEHTPAAPPPADPPLLALDRQLAADAARARAAREEEVLAAHLDTHTPAQFAAEIARLRALKEPRP